MDALAWYSIGFGALGVALVSHKPEGLLMPNLGVAIPNLSGSRGNT